MQNVRPSLGVVILLPGRSVLENQAWGKAVSSSLSFVRSSSGNLGCGLSTARKKALLFHSLGLILFCTRKRQGNNSKNCKVHLFPWLDFKHIYFSLSYCEFLCKCVLKALLLSANPSRLNLNSKLLGKTDSSLISTGLAILSHKHLNKHLDSCRNHEWSKWTVRL